MYLIGWPERAANGGSTTSRIGLAQEVHQLGDVDAPDLIAAEQVNGPRDVWSVPFKVVGVISTFLQAQEGRDEVPPQLVATQTYQPAATDNVPDVGFVFEKQSGHEQPQAGRNHSNHNHEQKSLAHRLLDRIALVSSKWTCASTFPLASRTVKQASCSSTEDQGGGNSLSRLRAALVLGAARAKHLLCDLRSGALTGDHPTI